MPNGGYDDQGEIARRDPKVVPYQERFHPRGGGSDQEGERMGRRVSLVSLRVGPLGPGEIWSEEADFVWSGLADNRGPA